MMFSKMACIWILIPSIALAGGRAVPASGEQLSSFGPMAAIAFDGEKSRISGFYHFKQIQMPDASFHADCQIYFSGTYENAPQIHVQVADVSAKRQKVVSGLLTIEEYGPSTPKLAGIQVYTLRLNSELPGCTDMLDMSDSAFQIELNRNGDWKGVEVIRAKRSHFYRRPDEKEKSAAYLVAGNLVYLYDQTPDWYYVKFRGEKTETSGWIKKADTLQLTKSASH